MATILVDQRHVRFKTVRDALSRAGCSDEENVGTGILVWHDSLFSRNYFARLMPWQTVNRIPRATVLSRKVPFVSSLRKAAEMFPAFYGFLPQSFILPQEAAEFEKARGDREFYVKPNNGSLGNGITIVKSGQKVETDEMAVVQEMVEPFLIDNRKFDLRLYVLVASVKPLKVFVYRDGLARFCAYEYGSESVYSNLTNVTLNKTCEGAEIAQISRLISELFPRLAENGVDIDALWKRIDDAIMLSIAAVHRYMLDGERNECMRVCYSRCFQVFGFDVILDKDLNPYVLEVNYRPSLEFNRPCERRMKTMMLSDAISLSLPPDVMQKMLMERGDGWFPDSFYGIVERKAKKRVSTVAEVKNILENSKYELVYPRKDAQGVKWRSVMHGLSGLPVDLVIGETDTPGEHIKGEEA